MTVEKQEWCRAVPWACQQGDGRGQGLLLCGAPIPEGLRGGGVFSYSHACNAGDLGSIPVLGGSPGEGKGYPLQYSVMENSMDCIVHGVAKSQTRLKRLSFSLPKC